MKTADALSNLGLYGNHKVFAKHAKNGCTKISFGGGPWVGSNRLVGVFIFFFPKRVETLETWKADDGVTIVRGRGENSYTKKQFRSLIAQWQLRVARTRSLTAILKEWDGKVDFN